MSMIMIACCVGLGAVMGFIQRNEIGDNAAMYYRGSVDMVESFFRDIEKFADAEKK